MDNIYIIAKVKGENGKVAFTFQFTVNEPTGALEGRGKSAYIAEL